MSGQINSFGDGLLAFGVGAIGGAVGTFAGGLGLGMAVTTLGTTGGFVAGAAAGFSSSLFSIPTLSFGNHLAFGDPLTSAEDYAMGLLFGTITGGMNGGLGSKLLYNENFWVGNPIPRHSLALNVNGGGTVSIDDTDVSVMSMAKKGRGKSGTSNAISKPLEKHHVATNKNKIYTPKFEAIVSRFGLNLNDSWNIKLMPHHGRHPNDYHEWVLERMYIYNFDKRSDSGTFYS